MSSAGYSGTPLWKKLGIKPGMRLRTRGAPGDYEDLIAPIPNGVTLSTSIRTNIDLVHLFTRSRAELTEWVPKLLSMIQRDGMIWVSWPKRASRVPTDVTEDTIREIALPLGLVDVKVCAVDATWSGLKLVIRKELR